MGVTIGFGRRSGTAVPVDDFRARLAPQDVYQSMMRAASPSSAATSDVRAPAWTWPEASPETTQMMVLLLARELRVQDALDVIECIRSRGLPSSSEVPFGHVIASPAAPDKPLTVRSRARSRCLT